MWPMARTRVYVNSVSQDTTAPMLVCLAHRPPVLPAGIAPSAHGLTSQQYLVMTRLTAAFVQLTSWVGCVRQGPTAQLDHLLRYHAIQENIACRMNLAWPVGTVLLATTVLAAPFFPTQSMKQLGIFVQRDTTVQQVVPTQHLVYQEPMQAACRTRMRPTVCHVRPATIALVMVEIYQMENVTLDGTVQKEWLSRNHQVKNVLLGMSVQREVHRWLHVHQENTSHYQVKAPACTARLGCTVTKMKPLLRHRAEQMLRRMVLSPLRPARQDSIVQMARGPPVRILALLEPTVIPPASRMAQSVVCVLKVFTARQRTSQSQLDNVPLVSTVFLVHRPWPRPWTPTGDHVPREPSVKKAAAGQVPARKEHSGIVTVCHQSKTALSAHLGSFVHIQV